MTLESTHNLPDTELVIIVTRVQDLSIRGPSKRKGLGLLLVEGVGAELLQNLALLKIVDLDASGSGSSQPKTGRRESESEDLAVGRKGVQELGVVQVPDENLTVLTTRSTKGSVRRQSDGGNSAVVADEVGGQTAGAEIPSLS